MKRLQLWSTDFLKSSIIKNMRSVIGTFQFAMCQNCSSDDSSASGFLHRSTRLEAKKAFDIAQKPPLHESKSILFYDNR